MGEFRQDQRVSLWFSDKPGLYGYQVYFLRVFEEKKNDFMSLVKGQ